MKGVSIIGGREVCDKSAAGRMEYRRRTLQMASRQDWLCALCGQWMRAHEASFEHQDGRGMGGGNRNDVTELEGEWYNAATHSICNGAKGSRRFRWVNGKFIAG